MSKKSISLVSVAVLLLSLGLVGLVMAQDDDDEGPMSDLRFVVVTDYNGKPVRNAAVVLHPVRKNGKQARGGMELKTDNDGRDEYRRDSVWPAAGAGAGAGFPDLWGRLRDQQAAVGNSR